MQSRQFEGWRIYFDEASCGRIKFLPKEDVTFSKHVSVDISINQIYRGRGIGKVALVKALEQSDCLRFVAFCRKSNSAAKRILEAAGFKKVEYPRSKQLCFLYERA